jgi:hypothetical protein
MSQSNSDSWVTANVIGVEEARVRIDAAVRPHLERQKLVETARGPGAQGSGAQGTGARGSGASSQPVNVFVNTPNGANGVNVSTQNDRSNSPRYMYPSTLKCRRQTFIGTPDPAFLKPPGCVICDYKVDADQRDNRPQGGHQTSFDGK